MVKDIHTHTHKLVFARRWSESVPISCLLIKTDKEKHWTRFRKTDLLSSSVDLALTH